jgi:hypothetical protein
MHLFDHVRIHDHAGSGQELRESMVELRILSLGLAGVLFAVMEFPIAP